MRNSFARFWSLVLAAALLLPLHAAAEPTIVAPTEPVPIGAFCDVTITGMDLPQSLRWETVPTEPVRVTAAWGTTDPVLSLPTHANRKVALVLMWKDSAEGEIQHRQIALVIGTGPAPVPVPPVPVPPDPDPTPTPVPTGKRVVWIVYESTQQTIELGKLLTTIRQPPHSDYLLDKGHVLAQIDDDIPDLPPEGVAMRPHVQGMALPVVLIAEKGTNKLVHKQTIPNNWTAANVIELVRAHGG